MKRSNGVSFLSNYENKLRHIVLGVFLVVFFFVATSSLITSLSGNMKISFERIKNVTSKIDNSFYISILSLENPYFGQLLKNDSPKYSFSEMLLKVVTSITPSDPRTFLGNEIPGLSSYHTKIYVARKGTNIATLPFDKPPSKKELEKEGKALDDYKEEKKEEKPAEKTPPSITTNGKKVVYIYSTHSRESYYPMQEEGSRTAFHSKANVTYVGEQIGKNLVNKGIGNFVDVTDFTGIQLEKKMDYARAYDVSKEEVQKQLKNDANLEYVIDIHRDTLAKKYTTATINGEKYAKIMFVVGEDNPSYKKNLAIVKEFEAMVEKKFKGLSRGIRGQGGPGNNGVYNQDLSPFAMTIEVGGLHNTAEELNRTARAIAEVFTEMYWKREGK